jgi:hypothetical protein
MEFWKCLWLHCCFSVSLLSGSVELLYPLLAFGSLVFKIPTLLRNDRPPKSKLYGVWITTLSSSPSDYILQSAVPSHLWNEQQRVLRFPYQNGRMGSLVSSHETKPNLIITFGFNQSKEGLRVQVDQLSSKDLSMPKFSPFLSEDPRTESVLPTPKCITVTAVRDIVLGCDVFIVDIEVNSAESSYGMLHI